MFDESSRTLQDIAANPRHLGAELGFFGVLHTWTRQLILHPHIHYIVAGGGLAADHATWHALPQPDFLLHGNVLAARFRTRLGARLQADEPALHAETPSSVWRADWVVDCEAVGSGATALRYLSAYVFRTAFGGKREITELPDGRVSFEYVESKTKERRTCTLECNDFIARFLQHVLPPGQHRVRYPPEADKFWVDASVREETPADRRRSAPARRWPHLRCGPQRSGGRGARVPASGQSAAQTLLAVRIVVRPKCEPPPAWHRCCPHCNQFTLIVVMKLARAPP